MRLSLFKNKKGIGITEALVAAAVLGFLYVAVLNLNNGNHQAMLRLRSRDAAVEVAQVVLDSLKKNGLSMVQSSYDADTTFPGLTYKRYWARQYGNDSSAIDYDTELTVFADRNFESDASSFYKEQKIIYAKMVNVKVSWQFNGSTQSINVSDVIR